MDAGLGFAPALQAELRRGGVMAEVFCAAVSGDTAADGLARICEVLARRPHIAVVQFGYNDLYYGKTPDEAKTSLAEMIVRLKNAGVAVLLAGVHAPPHVSPKTKKRFAEIYEELAVEHGAQLHPNFLAGVAPSMYLPDDDVHPNAEGVRAVAANIAPRIVALAESVCMETAEV